MTHTRCEHPAGRLLFWLKRDNNYDCTDQAGLLVWLPDWVPDSMADTGDKVSRLSWYPSPKQQTVLLDEQKNSTRSSSSSDVLRLLLCLISTLLVFPRLSNCFHLFCSIFSTWIWFYEKYVRTKKDSRYKCIENCVCRIMVIDNHEYK